MTHSIVHVADDDAEYMKGRFEIRNVRELNLFLERLGHTAAALWPEWAEEEDEEQGQGREAAQEAEAPAAQAPPAPAAAAGMAHRAYLDRLSESERSRLTERQAIVVGMKRAGMKRVDIANAVGASVAAIDQRLGQAKQAGVTP